MSEQRAERRARGGWGRGSSKSVQSHIEVTGCHNAGIELRRWIPDGLGAASTGSRPRSMRHCRATARPVRRHVRPSLLSYAQGHRKYQRHLQPLGWYPDW